MSGCLVVHTRREVIEIRLTGDPQLDALLERFAARGGVVLRENGALDTSDRGDAWEPERAA